MQNHKNLHPSRLEGIKRLFSCLPKLLNLQANFLDDIQNGSHIYNSTNILKQKGGKKQENHK